MLPINLPFFVLLQSNTAGTTREKGREVMDKWGSAPHRVRVYVWSNVRNVRVNSTLEKMPRKRKWSTWRVKHEVLRSCDSRTIRFYHIQ